MNPTTQKAAERVKRSQTHQPTGSGNPPPGNVPPLPSGVTPETSATDVRILTRCPACKHDTLMINKGHLLCTWVECPDPTLIDRDFQATSKAAAFLAPLPRLTGHSELLVAGGVLVLSDGMRLVMDKVIGYRKTNGYENPVTPGRGHYEFTIYIAGCQPVTHVAETDITEQLDALFGGRAM